MYSILQTKKAPHELGGFFKFYWITLKNNQNVQLNVIDLTGRLVTSLLNGDLNSGLYEYTIPVNTPGIYFVDLVSGGKRHVRKLVISE